MSRSKITLSELHEHLVKTSIKDNAVFAAMTALELEQYFQKNFADPEYRIDNWYHTVIPLEKLVSNNEEFRREIFFNKEPTYLSQWALIKPQFEKLLDRWLLDKKGFSDGTYPAIVAREDARKGLYRVWDGQRRTLNAFWHELAEIDAYVFTDP